MEFQDSKGHQLSYRVNGKGPILVLVHGYGGSPSNWHSVVEILAEKYTCYSLNLTKNYYSKSSSENLESFVRLLSEFIRHLKKDYQQEVFVCGNSFGGTLLQAVSYRCHECIKKMVLVGPMPIRPLNQLRDPILRLITFFGRFKTLNYILLKSWLGGILYPYLSEIWRVTDEPHKKRKKIVSWKDFGERKIRLLVFAIARFCELSNGARWSKLFPKKKSVKIKTLIIWGGLDRLWRYGTEVKLQKYFSNAQLNYIQNAGHIVMTDQPKACANYIDLFLMEHSHSR